ncbi:MAG: zeta toxin family protein [Eggerthellaceae bacterium]|nr:zeta toxin family protein [Eggerthellaceae bacterium]
MSLAEYTESEFREKQSRLVKSLVLQGSACPSEKPIAFLLGGQSGAGKTTLHEILLSEMEDDAIVINGDEYRSYHPRYRQLDAKYGRDAVIHTATWAGNMVESLIDAFSLVGYNLVVEGTLRTSQAPLKSAALLRSRGYGVSLALMAVKPEISLVSCQIRYELMRQAGTVPRAVDPVFHSKIVQDIVGNLEVLEESGQFDEIRLYTRSREMLFPQEDARVRASGVLRDVLFGKWTEQELRHYAQLKAKLEQLKAAS